MIEILDLAPSGVVLLALEDAPFLVTRLPFGSFVAENFDVGVGAVQRNSAQRARRVHVDLKMHGHAL